MRSRYKPSHAKSAEKYLTTKHSTSLWWTPKQGKWSLKSSWPATHTWFVNWSKIEATGITGVTCRLPEHSHLGSSFCIQHKMTIGVHRWFQQHTSPSLTSAGYCCHILSQKPPHRRTGVSFQQHFIFCCKGTDLILLSLDQPSTSSWPPED